MLARKFINAELKKITERTMILLGIVLILFTAVAAIFIGHALSHENGTIFDTFDRIVYEKINLGPHPNWLNALVSPFNFNFLPWGGTFIPSFLFFVIGLAFLYILVYNRKNFGWAIVLFFAALIADTIIFKITNTYVLRDRPFLHLSNTVSDSGKAIWIHWPTYPSGHVRDLALYATVLGNYAKKLIIPFWLLVIWIGYTRIYIGAHYPTDVIAGALIGYGIGTGLILISNAAQSYRLKNK